LFASIAIGILTLGASHIAVGLIHNSPEWASRFKASLTGNQAKTAYIINDAATGTLKFNKPLLTQKINEIETSLNRARMVRGPLLVKELAEWIKKLENFEEGLTKSLTTKGGDLSSDDQLRYDNLQNAIKALKGYLSELQSKENKGTLKEKIYTDFTVIEYVTNHIISMINIMSPDYK
jgi:hypothetical protein